MPLKGTIWIGMLVALILTGSITLPRLQATPLAPVAAVFPPLMNRDVALRAVVGTGAAIIERGPLPNIVIVSAENAGQIIALYRAGAWSLIRLGGRYGCAF